jgi:hypothetical protein
VGWAQVETSGLVVELVVGNGASTVTFACALPSSSTGAGDCEVSVAGDTVDGWFLTLWDVSITIQVQVTYGTVSSELGNTLSGVLAQRVEYTTLGSAGMYLGILTAPQVAGTTFATTIYANTGGYALGSWTIQILFSPSLLSVDSFAVNAAYDAPIISGSSGVYGVFVSQTAAGVAAADVTGSAVRHRFRN